MREIIPFKGLLGTANLLYHLWPTERHWAAPLPLPQPWQDPRNFCEALLLHGIFGKELQRCAADRTCLFSPITDRDHKVQCSILEFPERFGALTGDIDANLLHERKTPRRSTFVASRPFCKFRIAPHKESSKDLRPSVIWLSCGSTKRKTSFFHVNSYLLPSPLQLCMIKYTYFDFFLQLVLKVFNMW